MGRMRGDEPQQRRLMLFGLRQSFFLCAPATAALLVLRRPVIQLLFERGEFGPEATALSAGALQYAAAGLIAFAWVKVMVQGYFSRQDTRTPVVVAALSMLLNILLNLVLVRPMGYQGLALSTSISFTVNFVVLYLLFGKRYGLLWDAPFVRSVAGVLLATLLFAVTAHFAMNGVAAWLGDDSLAALFCALAAAGIAGGVMFSGACLVLRVPEFDALCKRFLRR